LWVFDHGRKKNYEIFFGKETWELFLPSLPEYLLNNDGTMFETIPLEYDPVDPELDQEEEILTGLPKSKLH
jgi:hypothetical protein